MTRTTSFAVALSCAGLVSLARAQGLTPSDFLNRMPKPPVTTSEALERCPQESDTLVARHATQLQSLERAEQSRIERDSLAFENPRRLPTVSPREMQEYRALHQEVDGQRDSLVARLERVKRTSSESVLATIRLIGEDLDKEIVRCPKVGASGVFDSVCVEAAEAYAAKKRMDVCNAFLATINAEWNSILEPLRQSLPSREKRISQLYSTSKHVKLKLQLGRLRLESWQTLAPILTTIDEVTRLAAQFSR